MKEMLINVSEGEECRIALVDNGRLEELYMERTSATSHVGNIYKGRVTNVEASIQAAFVDFGLGRNGFLHISDLMPTYFGRQGSDVQETVGRKMARRDRPPIQRCLRRGDEIIVQIIKEGIGTKGPTLSTYLSIPGKILVMMPGMGKMGVSKKIEDEAERRRLRTILDAMDRPEDLAFIIRTAGIGKTKLEIERDFKYLTRLWEQIQDRQRDPGPIELYTEGDLVARTVRDVYSADVDRIVIDNWDVAKSVKDVLKIGNPRGRNRVEVYEQDVPLFHKYGIEREIELMYSRHVPLQSGGSLVIDSTEAVVAIDVNSGKFRDHSDAETTAFKIDMEAADEITRQLKLRDLGGVIICDFIDLRYERHRRELEERLHENFKNDRAKTKVLRMSQFGIIEITRQRMRPSLKRSIYFDCPHCKGAGLVKTPESMALDSMRKLQIALADLKVVRAQLSVCSEIAFYLLNKKRAALSDLEHHTEKKITVLADPTLALDEQRFELFDARDGTVILEELGMTLTGHPHTTQLGAPPRGQSSSGRGRSDGGRGRGGRGGAAGSSGGVGGERDRSDTRSIPTRPADDEPDLEEDRIPGGIDEDSEIAGPGDAAYDREEDAPDLSPVLETEAGDQIAEELADEEMEADDDRNDRDHPDDRDASPALRQPAQSRAPQPRNNPGRPSPSRDNGPRQNAPRENLSRDNVGRDNAGRDNASRGGAPREPAGVPRNDRGGPYPDNANGEGGDGGRRRRRRRGRRGRGRGGDNGGNGGNGGGNNGGDDRYADAGANGSPGDLPGEDDLNDQPAPPRPPRALSMAEMAGQIAGELANEMGDFEGEDAPPRKPGIGTPNAAEPSDAVGPAAEGGESASGDDGAEPAADQPRRRRRRGGRRHRRRGTETEGAAPAEEGDEPASESADEAPAPAPEVSTGASDDAAEPESGDDAPPPRRARARATPKRTPPKSPRASRAKSAAAEAPESVTIETGTVVPTGTADTHLAEEPIDEEPEPIDTPVLPRPRSYSDLDAIPDDYD